jgi:diacylglycerol kinase (ATP)
MTGVLRRRKTCVTTRAPPHPSTWQHSVASHVPFDLPCGMRVAVIINPIAGSRARGGSAGQRVDAARRVMARHGVQATIYLTGAAGDARTMARRAVEDGCDLVVAWGGDGTVNEVAGALVHRPVALGIVPAGSGNGLAHGLGIPNRPAAALEAALAGADRSIDVGELGGRLFVNVGGVGFDADIARRFDRLGPTRGFLAYVRSTAPRLLSHQAAPCTLEIDGETISARVLLVTVANCREFGGHAVIAPRAKPDDGLLDLVVIPERAALDRLTLIPHVFAGTLDRVEGVLMRQVTRVVISSDRALPFHVDGEPHEGGRALEARIIPSALMVRG